MSLPRIITSSSGMLKRSPGLDNLNEIYKKRVTYFLSESPLHGLDNPNIKPLFKPEFLCKNGALKVNEDEKLKNGGADRI